MGQEGRELFFHNAAFSVGEVDHKVRAAELAHYLTADTAGGAGGIWGVLAAYNSDGGKVPSAVKNGLKDGGAFRANGGGKGGVSMLQPV